MAPPIFPGVGTRSRLADVFQGQNELGLQEEALNRQSGQQLLQLLTQAGFQTGDLVTRISEGNLEREAALGRTETQAAGQLAATTERGVQARLTDQAAFEREALAPADRFDTKAAELKIEATSLAEQRLLKEAGGPGATPVTFEEIEKLANEIFRADLRALTLSNLEEAALSETGRIMIDELRREGVLADPGGFSGLPPSEGIGPGQPRVAPFGIGRPPPQPPPALPTIETEAQRAAKRRLRQPQRLVPGGSALERRLPIRPGAF